MRSFIAIAVVAITIPFLNVGSASAEGLKGEQIKKLLIGNTLFARSGKNTRWIYYPNESTRIVQRNRFRRGWSTEFHFVTKWRVTKDGKYCHENRKGKEKCRNNIRINENIIKMDGVDGVSDLEYKFLK